MKEYIKKPIYPVLGNHEMSPVNQYEGNGTHDKWLYETTATLWSDWLSEEELKMVRWGGFYTTTVKGGHRLIVLNTNIYLQERFL